MIDDNRFTALTNLVTDRGLDLEFAARLQTEMNVVENAASYPAILRDPGHGGKSHPGGPAHNIENSWNTVDVAYGIDVRLEFACHPATLSCHPARALSN